MAFKAAEEKVSKSAIWTPQPGPQVEAILADWCPILLYGGAKFGGKSDFLLGDYLQDLPTYREHWQGVLFRRALTEFTELKLRASELFPKAGGIWKQQQQEWHFPDYGKGGLVPILRFRYLEKFEQISLYEGHSYPWIGIDELGDWEDPNAFFRIVTLNRYGRAKIDRIRLRASCNPGGRGHAWLKRYFFDPAPGGYTPLWDDELKCYRLFIPAKLDDNKIGMANDPGYEHRLNRAGSPALVRALRHGDWTVVAGAFFSKFSSRNVVRPHEVPSHLTRFMALDPGSSDPFAITWWFVADGLPIGGQVYPRGACVCYREWYGEKTEEDGERVRGLKLSTDELANGIHERELGENISYRVAGHDLWDTRRGPSEQEKLAVLGIVFGRAEISRKPGWKNMHDMIAGKDGVPMAYWFESCVKCIESIPLLQHSKRDAEDVEDSPNDHAPDSCRYALMGRVTVSDKKSSEKPLSQQFKPPTIDELWAAREAAMRGRR